MSIDTIITQIPDIKERIAQLEEMAEDYKSCKSSVTKKLLTQAIEKYAANVAFKSSADSQNA